MHAYNVTVFSNISRSVSHTEKCSELLTRVARSWPPITGHGMGVYTGRWVGVCVCSSGVQAKHSISVGQCWCTVRHGQCVCML